MIAARRFTLVAAMVAGLVLVASPVPAAAQQPCGLYHTVGSGDSLVSIAERCGVTLPALLAANPGVRDQRRLEVGDRITLPSPRDRQPTPQQACGAYYRAHPGDTLAGIARKCGLTVPLLVAANGRFPDAPTIAAGTRVRIPDLPTTAVADTTTIAVATPLPGAADPAADPPADTLDEAVAAPAELTRVEGTLERGAVCMLLRADDGTTVALDGRIGQAYEPGQRVVIMGLPVDADRCGHDPTVELRIMHRPGR